MTYKLSYDVLGVADIAGRHIQCGRIIHFSISLTDGVSSWYDVGATVSARSSEIFFPNINWVSDYVARSCYTTFVSRLIVRLATTASSESDNKKITMNSRI